MVTTLQQKGRSSALPFEIYLRDIDKTPLLDADEEQDLAWRIDEGDSEARDHMVRANLRLVVRIASGYVNKGLSLEDLIAEGNLGLLRAAEGFDPSMGIRFSTYASYWIKQSVRRALINTGKTVRLPAYIVQLLTQWKQATARLVEELGRTPTQEEVADRLGLSMKKLKIIQKASRIHNAVLQQDAEDEGFKLGEIAKDDEAGPDAGLTGADEMRQVLGLIEQMPPREATVLRLRFGLNGEEPRTLQEIATRLGLTRERVRQIERVALQKLRLKLETM